MTAFCERDKAIHFFIGRELPAQAAFMSHEIAKLLLEHARTVLERTDAIRTALRLGMPLHEIEAYFDWIDLMQSQHRDADARELNGHGGGPPAGQ